MQLHYQQLGHGQPLILLHGLFGSADNWRMIAKHFSQTYQVISVDLRNHGRSPHSDAQDYSNMADDLIELCDALHLDNIHLLGHSLGGKVAMQFAAQYPTRVNRLIIIDIAMRAYADQHTGLIDAMMAVDLSSMQSRAEVDQALMHRIPNAMVRQFLLMNIVKADDGLQWRINLPALKNNYPALQQAVCENSQYNQPSLFIYGEHSDYVKNTDIEQIKRHFRQATFISLATDHWVHAEQPQAFIETVTQFLHGSTAA